MLSGDFIELLQRQPFQPLRLHLSNGTTYDIRHPEMALVRSSVVWVNFPPQTLPIPIAERRVIVNLNHIVEIEFIPDPKAPSVN
ncbi:MAG: hypothetical protein L0Z62_34170 [Gemmataceae bacterium]|nr:hypothetical protein [Gemmataceae bacterium]